MDLTDECSILDNFEQPRFQNKKIQSFFEHLKLTPIEQ